MPVDRTLRDTTRRVISFPDKYAAFRHVVSAFRGLLGIRGLWTMADFDVNGNAEDLTNYDLLLTRNSHSLVTYNLYNSLVPYVDLDGAGDYLSRADEAALDILGTEAHLDADWRGLTVGGWSWFDNLTRTEGLLSKWNDSGVNQRSYLLLKDTATDRLRFLVSTDGTAVVNVTSSVVPTASKWHFTVGRFDPSAELAVYVNGVWTVNTTGIPASIFASTADFHIGRYDGTPDYLDGRQSISFLCAAYLSDDAVGALFQQSRALYGV